MAVANMTALIERKRPYARLDRDEIYLAVGDGGAADGSGMKFAVETNRDKIAAGFAINTGGRVVVKDGHVQYAGIQVAEKVSRNLDVIATGTPGRSWLPDENNAVAHLA